MIDVGNRCDLTYKSKNAQKSNKLKTCNRCRTQVIHQSRKKHREIKNNTDLYPDKLATIVHDHGIHSQDSLKSMVFR